MLKISLVTLFIYFSSVAFATNPERGSFSGKVMNAETGKPVIGATIYITNLKQGTSTNEAGYFLFKQVSEGQQLVEISHIGFNTIAVNILIQGDTYKTFSLTPSIVENTTVVVTGVSHATTLRKTPFQVTVIQKDELQKRLSQKPNDSIEKRGLDYLLDIQARLKETILKLNIKHIFIDASLNIDEIAKKIEDFINAK